jgi:alpha/beta superfamily hydrolase
MPEIIYSGPEGRLEGRVNVVEGKRSPVAMILHPLPQFGGNMNNPIVYNLYQTFIKKGFSVLRFNFRGVGKSQGDFDHGIGELSDAAASLDWVQSQVSDSKGCWVAGYSFGAWIAMQLLMRRPEIEGFISISPPANMYDFNFLAPCPSSGIILHGEEDKVVPKEDIVRLVEKLQLQRNIEVDYKSISGANHFFENKTDKLIKQVNKYLDSRLVGPDI